MNIDMLASYKIKPEILKAWRDTIGTVLLSVQERAVLEGALSANGRVVVISPTGSGKTFVGEMAAARVASEDGKVFYVLPLRALADQKYEELRERYAPAGIKVVISSRDHREFDADIERGNFQIAIVVVEKLLSLIVGSPQILNTVGLVVVDELHMIGDPTRGPDLELLLTMIKAAKSKPRIIGLSAVIGNGKPLAEWLGATLVFDKHRPVELRKGVLCRGTFTYREHNSGVQGTETFVDPDTEEPHELILSAAEYLVSRGEQVLVFLGDKKRTVGYAATLANRLRQPSVDEAIEELLEQEETLSRAQLRQALTSSVAFHNADLSLEERRLVERYFRLGKIRALFSTSTLAMGMNLPVQNVIIDLERRGFLPEYGKWGLLSVSKSTYENESGRAGRPGLSTGMARSILVTASPFQAEAWLAKFVSADFEELRPCLGDGPLEDHILHAAAAGLAPSREALTRLFLGTFTGFLRWAGNQDEFRAALDAALQKCLDGKLIVEEKGRLEVTELGMVTASKGIGAETALEMATWARDARNVPVTDIEVLTTVSLSSAGGGVYVPMSRSERFDYDLRSELLRHASAAGASERPALARFAEASSAAEAKPAEAIKRVLMLTDWLDEMGTKTLELRHRAGGGGARRIGEEFAWLVQALSAVAKICGWTRERCGELDELADRLNFGVRADALPIARLRIFGLARSFVRGLVEAGFGDEDALAKASQEDLRKALHHRRLAERVWNRFHPAEAPTIAIATERQMLRAAETAPEYQATPKAASPTAPQAQSAAIAPPSDALVLRKKQRRITLRGKDLPIRPPNNMQRTPFLGFAVLCEKPNTVLSMAEIAEGMKRHGRVAKRLVAPDARDLRYRIVRPLKAVFAEVLGVEEINRMVESIPGVGLRLNYAGPVQVLDE